MLGRDRMVRSRDAANLTSVPYGTSPESSLSIPPVDGLARLAWVMLWFAVALTPVSILRVGAVAVGDLVFLIAALACLGSRIPRPRPQTAVHLAVALGIVSVAFASSVAKDPSSSLAIGARLIYVWTVLQWTMRTLSSGPSYVRSLGMAFSLGATLSALAGILQVYPGISIPGSIMIHGRSAGLQFHPNGQGATLAIAITILFAFLVFKEVPRLLLVLLLVCCLAGLLTSGSVSGLVAALVGVFFVLVFRRVSVTTLMASSGVVVVGWVLLTHIQQLIPGSVSPFERLSDSTGSGIGESTLAIRLETIRFALDEIARNPLGGVGLDPISGATVDGVTQVHNIVILYWFQGGILMLIALMIILASWVLPALKQSLRGPTAENVMAVSATAAALTVALSGPVIVDRWFWITVLFCACVRGRD